MKWITFFHQVYFCISELGKAKLKSISMAGPFCPTSRKEGETGIPENTKRGSGVGRPHQSRRNVSRRQQRCWGSRRGDPLGQESCKAAYSAEMAVLTLRTETVISGFMSAYAQLRKLDSEGKDPPHLPPLLPQPGRDG